MTELRRLDAPEVGAAPGLDDWRVLLRSLHTSFRTTTMATGAAFAGRIAAAADEADHHPDLRVRYSRVDVTLTTHDVQGLSRLDVELARTISAIAAEMGLSADPRSVSVVEVAIDALDRPAVQPFWAALLGYREGWHPDDLVDPYARNPTFWFQQMDAPRPQRNRIHLDVHVPHDVAEERIAAAIAAGGVLLSDAEAPSFWVLADPEGNEACICTWQDRA